MKADTKVVKAVDKKKAKWKREQKIALAMSLIMAISIRFNPWVTMVSYRQIQTFIH